jgi:hypothetical protein
MKSFSLFPSDGPEENAKPRLYLYMIFFLIWGGRTQTGFLPLGLRARSLKKFILLER